MEKDTTYYHTTSKDSIDKILSSGFIKSPKHILREAPELTINIEPSKLSKSRSSYSPSDAIIELIRNKKEYDRVFLTKGGYDPSYGDYVIQKKITSPKRYFRPTFIPNEHTIKRKLSVKSNAAIIIPDNDLEEMKSKHPGINFIPASTANVKKFNIIDKIVSVPKDLLKAASDIAAVPKPHHISPKAFYAGSHALGINTKDSDIDIFVPYKTKPAFDKAINRVLEKYPSLTIGSASADKPDKRVLTGIFNGKDVDIAIAHGKNAIKFQEVFMNAKKSLSDQQKIDIIKKKQALKESWFFPELRYKAYKNRVAERLGLKEAYF